MQVMPVPSPHGPGTRRLGASSRLQGGSRVGDRYRGPRASPGFGPLAAVRWRCAEGLGLRGELRDKSAAARSPRNWTLYSGEISLSSMDGERLAGRSPAWHISQGSAARLVRPPRKWI